MRVPGLLSIQLYEQCLRHRYVSRTQTTVGIRPTHSSTLDPRTDTESSRQDPTGPESLILPGPIRVHLPSQTLLRPRLPRTPTETLGQKPDVVGGLDGGEENQ